MIGGDAAQALKSEAGGKVDKPSEKHILEDLVAAVGGGGFEERESVLHSVMLLSFYKAVYSLVSRDVIIPTLWGVAYNKSTNQVSIVSHNGYAPVPRKDGYDVDGLDLIVAANLRGSMPLLLEGDTGTGKTLLTEKYLATILERSNYVVFTLSQNQLANNPLQSFTKRDPDDVTKTHLDTEALERVVAIFVDEVNRGSTQVLLQLSHGRIHIGGENGEVKRPIPTITEHGLEHQPDNYKKLFFIGAQNPSQQKDATFSGTMELDAALSNRLLTVEFPVLTKSAGASIMRVSNTPGLHEKFIVQFAKYMASFLKVPVDGEKLSRQWIDVYAYLTNPHRTDKAFLSSSLEFSDLASVMLAGNIIGIYDSEREMTRSWDSYMASAGINTQFALPPTPITATQAVNRLEETVETFGKPMMPRDLAKLKILADIFATIKSMKGALGSPSPVEVYQQTGGYVTVEDIAAALTVVGKSKQLRVTDKDPSTTVNSILKDYVDIVREVAFRVTGKEQQFDINSPGPSIMNYVLANALRQSDTSRAVIEKFGSHAASLKSLQMTNEFRRFIVGRAVGDLAVLSGFLCDYSREVDEILAEAKGKGVDEKIPLVLDGLSRLYQDKREDPLMPDIYRHRLEKVFG